MIAQTVWRVGSICVLGSLSIRSGIPLRESNGHDSLDEIRLGCGIPLQRLDVGRRDLRGHGAFEVFVLASHIGMVTEIVAKRECSSFFTPSPLDNMHVMCMGPVARTMEERAE